MNWPFKVSRHNLQSIMEICWIHFSVNSCTVVDQWGVKIVINQPRHEIQYCVFRNSHSQQHLSCSICSLLFVILQCNISALSYHESTESLKCLPIMDHSSHTVHIHHHIPVMFKWFWKLLAFQRDCLSSREPWCRKSVFMEGDTMGFFQLTMAGLIGIDISFDVMSCNGISRGGICPFVEDRQAVTKAAPIKSDT